MTGLNGFIVLCGMMLGAALAWVLWPLFKVRQDSRTRSTNYSVMLFVAMCVVMLTVGLYMHISTWPWNQPTASAAPTAAQASAADTQAEITAYQARVKTNDRDVDGWLLLGSAQVKAEHFAEAITAYQKAYDLTQGQNMDAVTGLVEALVLSDPTNANGRAATLIDAALKREPNNAKALFYGGLLALQANNFVVARQRFQSVLALNPPDNVRTILQAQIDKINAQLGEAAPVAAERKVDVKVTLAANLKNKITSSTSSNPMSLFVMARNPTKGGPPLAVQRHQSNELPLQVQLSKADAMLPSLSIMTADEVDVVARLSKSGTPTEQSGDYYGTAHYSFVKQGEQGSVTIEINQQVP
jgi:cytochrome c-type biogenesis protein CcmH